MYVKMYACRHFSPDATTDQRNQKPKICWTGLGLRNRLTHRPHQLSGGEMQRTAIARALINDPAIVIADEPTGNLDSANARRVMALLADLNCHLDRTVIIATHSDLADPFATTMLRLQDGCVSDQ
jgi:putative ABC transport system ATP-binding protein